MNRHCSRPAAALLAALAVPLLSQCTDAGLYQWKTQPYQANKLTVTGTVCTDDLHQSDFPIKILFAIDITQALRAEQNDPNGNRGKAIEEMIALWGKNPNYHFGVTVFGSKAKNLLTDSTGQNPVGFTRDLSKLQSAITQIKSGGGNTDVSTCRAGRCRDIRAAVSLANSIISGDILASDPGTVARTTYVVLLFSGGSPVPALGRCGCRDREQEQSGGIWDGCPFKECDGCKVTCPPDTECQGSDCIPICSPPCNADEYCDPAQAGWQCVQGSPQVPPTVPPLSTVPQSVPDTFTFHVPPPSAAGQCNNLTCVFAAGGNPESCEERLLVQDVRELRNFAIKSGAGQFQLHTTYLPDKAPRPDTDPFYPPGPGACAGDKAADEARSVRLLSQMAYAGEGGFTQFAQAEAIPQGFLDIGRDLYATSDALVFKELVVFNRNVLPRADGIHPDTDADGLVDRDELALGTCISDKDTDGDGLSDAVETKLALDPTQPDTPVECIDLPTTQELGDDPCLPGQQKTWTRFTDDKDHDELNSCEERMLGTDDSLFDTDADGIPDRIEFVLGTNYMAIDPLDDTDLDGIVNRNEIRGHTDPGSNDSQEQLDLSYRYDEVDQGLKEVVSFAQPSAVTGVMIKNVSPKTTPGVGWLKFDPATSDPAVCNGAPPCPTLSWRDYSDMGVAGNFGPPVDVSQGNTEGFVLESCQSSADPLVPCTPDSASKFITVFVDPNSFPPKTTVDRINITSARRNCLRFTVRNITLMETGMDRLLQTVGNNTVDLYFAEAPARAKSGYGIFRIASVRLRYEKGPPEERTPKTPEIAFTDEDFILDISQ